MSQPYVVRKAARAIPDVGLPAGGYVVTRDDLSTVMVRHHAPPEDEALVVEQLCALKPVTVEDITSGHLGSRLQRRVDRPCPPASLRFPVTVRGLAAALMVLVAACGGEAPVADPPAAPAEVEADGDLALEHVVSLGGANAPYSMHDYPIPVADSRGRIAVRLRSLTEVGVFAPDGRLLRVLGGVGEGPGEFSRIVSALHYGPGDSLFVASYGTVDVFDDDLRFARSAPVAVGVSTNKLSVTPDSRIWLHGSVRWPVPITEPFHVLSPTGGVEASFGERVPGPYAYSVDAPGAWATRVRSDSVQVFERWREGQGGPDTLVVATGGGYRPWNETPEGLWLAARYAIPSASREDADRADRLSEAMRSAAATGPLDGADAARMMSDLRLHTTLSYAIFGTALALVDISSGEVVASGRLDKQIEAIPGTNLAWGRYFDQFSETVVDIWRVVPAR